MDKMNNKASVMREKASAQRQKERTICERCKINALKGQAITCTCTVNIAIPISFINGII